jgi:beta-barrel assembly-enhancing protease
MQEQQPGGLPARYSDGKSAASHVASVRFGSRGLELGIDGRTGPTWPYESLRVATPLDRSSRGALLSLTTDPDATLYVGNQVFCADLIARAPHLSTSAWRWRVLKPGLAVGGAALALGLTVWGLGLSPAKGIARLIPDKVRVSLGNAVVDGMVGNRRICGNLTGQAALLKLYKRLQPHADLSTTRIRVVDWSLVNAFAVPGGQVIITRAILERAGSADEVAGVVGHEIGHGLALHPETGLVRGLGFWAALQFFMTGSPGMLGSLGSMALQFSYTRDAEREADQYAIKLARDAGVSVKPFVGFFRKLDPDGRVSGGKAGPRGGVGSVLDILSTHPAPAERIAVIEAVPDYPSTPALDPADWAALRAICSGRPEPTLVAPLR